MNVSKRMLTASSIAKNSSGKVISGFEYTFDDMGRVSCDKNVAKNEKMCYTYDTHYISVSRCAIIYFCRLGNR